VNASVVMDASAAIKLVVDEEFSEQARTLLRDSAASAIVGPPALFSEVANTLHQRTRRQDPATHISPAEADAALDRFMALGLRLVVSDTIYRRAFDFARQHGLPNIYDTLYVVLAQELDTELWTDDRRLLDRVRMSAPWVRWIADYPLAPDDGAPA
jgi:predicted nucleic acid-binding protein